MQIDTWMPIYHMSKFHKLRIKLTVKYITYILSQWSDKPGSNLEISNFLNFFTKMIQ